MNHLLSKKKKKDVWGAVIYRGRKKIQKNIKCVNAAWKQNTVAPNKSVMWDENRCVIVEYQRQWINVYALQALGYSSNLAYFLLNIRHTQRLQILLEKFRPSFLETWLLLGDDFIADDLMHDHMQIGCMLSL